MDISENHSLKELERLKRKIEKQIEAKKSSKEDQGALYEMIKKDHEEGYNGKDLLECVEIDKKPGLIQKMDADGQPKRFQAHGKDCKIMKVITTDSKGQPTTMHKIDIPVEED